MLNIWRQLLWCELMNFFLTHDFLQVFLIVHLCFLFQVFVYFFFMSHILFNPGKPRLFHYHTTIQPTYPLPPSLPSFILSCLPHQLIPLTQPSLLQIPTVPPYTTHKLPSHLPFLCYTSHTHYHLTSPTWGTQCTHTTISQCLLLHLFICFTNYAPTLLLLMAHTLVTPPFLFLFLWKICSHVTLTVNKKNFPEISGGRIQGESRSQFSSSSPFLSSSSSLSPLLFLSSLTGTG